MEETILQKNQRRKLSKQEHLKADSQKFLSRPSAKIANPNKDLKQAYDKKFFKDKRFDHLRQLKKIRSKAEKDSVSSQFDEDDQEFNVQDERQRRKRKQSTDNFGQTTTRKRGRKPKLQPEHKDQQRETQSNSMERQAYVKKRGRPKGSINKNPPNRLPKEQPPQEMKIPKQFECLKKIQPKGKEASPPHKATESQSGSSGTQDNDKDKEQQVVKDSDKDNLVHLHTENKETHLNVQGNMNEPEKEEKKSQSESESQDEEQSQDNQQKQGGKQKSDGSEEDSSSGQSESEMSSEQSNKQKPIEQSEIVNPTSQNKPAQFKEQESIAPSRGKKLNIKSSSQQSQQSPHDKQNKIAAAQNNKNVQKDNNNPNTASNTSDNAVAKDEVISEEEQLAKLTKKRGRKSQQTQLEIQRLKEIISRKKGILQNKIQTKPQKSKPKPKPQQIQSSETEQDSQSQYQMKHEKKPIQHKPIRNTKQSTKQITKISAQKEIKTENEQKMPKEQIKITKQSQVVQRFRESKVDNRSMFDRKSIERDIIKQKMAKLGIRSKVLTHQIASQSPLDPLQIPLFKGWTKYYQKYAQAVATEVEEDQLQQPQKTQGFRKRPAEKKFKRYRKVIIEEEESDEESSQQSVQVVKKNKKQRRNKEPVKVIVHKKGKSKKKHKQSSSSGSYD